MIKKIKIGIILVLIGIGLPVVLFFFQENDVMFNLKNTKKESLRKTEVDTLNSIYDSAISLYKLSTALSEIKNFAKEKLPQDSPLRLEIYAFAYTAAKKIDKVNEDIDILTKESDAFRIEVGSGERLGKFVYPYTITESSLVSIPYHYFIGIGVMFFITGLGFIILPFIERKGRAS